MSTKNEYYRSVHEEKEEKEREVRRKRMLRVKEETLKHTDRSIHERSNALKSPGDHEAFNNHALPHSKWNIEAISAFRLRFLSEFYLILHSFLDRYHYVYIRIQPDNASTWNQGRKR